MAERYPRFDARNGALKVVLVYGVFAALWILLSDRVVGLLVRDPELIVRASVVKGWLFVLVTALLLSGLLRRLIMQLEASHQREFESERRFDASFEHAATGIAMVAPDGRWLRVNRKLCEIVGYGRDELLARDFQSITFPGDLDTDLEYIGRMLRGEIETYTREKRYVHKGGRPVWVNLTVSLVWRSDGVPDYFISVIDDIQARKDVEAALEQAEVELRIAATAFESQQAMLITDREHVILRVNKAFTETTGYRADEVIGKTPSILDAGPHEAELHREIDDGVVRDRYWQGEIRARRHNDESFPALASISAVVDEQGEVTNYVAAFVDLSQRKQAEELIHNLSFYDALTGLPNRRLLLDRLRQTLLSSRRSGAYGAVLFIDLDDFRALNDARGHDAGDQLLAGIAKRIRGCVHCDDTVARSGGDEFVVVLEGLAADGDQAATLAGQVAERILSAIRKPIALADGDHRCTASIGISLFRDEEATLDLLLSQADASMFQAKRTGRDMIHFFDAGMQAALEERVRLEAWLRRALPDQLSLHYQMQVDASGRIFAAEALIRWQHPERGAIPPMDFIPLAEETGLILPIGRWVLETACRQLKAWEASPATRDLLIAVNVSAREFQQPDFVEQVAEVLQATGANPDKLKLELTESMLVDDVEAVIGKMAALKERGIRFSLDDFGTGFSSLSYLKRLPLDQLKIDRSFVRDVLMDANDAAIVRTIIALGQSLGLAVIAEGVETEEQRDFLADHGCHYFQGYYFGKPLPRAQFEERLNGVAV